MPWLNHVTDPARGIDMCTDMCAEMRADMCVDMSSAPFLKVFVVLAADTSPPHRLGITVGDTDDATSYWMHGRSLGSRR